jgi:hypothetical protein
MKTEGSSDLDRNIHSSLMMEAVRTSETSVDNHFTRQYIPEDNSEHHTRRRENLKSHMDRNMFTISFRLTQCRGWVANINISYSGGPV